MSNVASPETRKIIYTHSHSVIDCVNHPLCVLNLLTGVPKAYIGSLVTGPVEPRYRDSDIHPILPE